MISAWRLLLVVPATVVLTVLFDWYVTTPWRIFAAWARK
jgi:hypothetical protein